MKTQPRVEVRELVFTEDVERWRMIAATLGGHEIINTPDYAEFWMPGGGLLGVHAASEQEKPGTCALQLVTENFDDACAALASQGFHGVASQEDFGRVFVVSNGPEGPDMTLVEGHISNHVIQPGAIMTTPLSLVRDVEVGKRFFETLGLTPVLRSEAGTFVEMTVSGGGEVLVHQGDGGSALSFQADDLGEVTAMCGRAGLGVSLVDEAYGRTALIEGPDGQVWVNERQHDFYGYVQLAASV